MKAFISATWKFFALVIVGIAPFLVIAGVVGWRDVVKIAVYGFFVALLATIPHGRTVGMQLSAAFAVLAAVGAGVQGSALGVTAVVGLAAALIPYYGYRDMLQAGIYAAMFLPNTVNPPPNPWAGTQTSSTMFIVAIGAVSMLGCLWGIFIGSAIRKRLPKRESQAPQPAKSRSVRTAWIAGVLIVGSTVVITYICVTQFPQTKWAWLLGTIYSMMVAVTGMTWKTSWELIAGTSIGALIAVLLLISSPPISLMMLAGAILMSASIALRVVNKPLWVATGVSTAGVIFLTGSSMDPLLAAEDRVIYTIIGAIIAVILGAALTAVLRWQDSQAVTDQPLKDQRAA